MFRLGMFWKYERTHFNNKVNYEGNCTGKALLSNHAGNPFPLIETTCYCEVLLKLCCTYV